MTLARSCNFLFALLPLLTGNITLSALDLPVELPSGQTIHLDISYAEVDPASYSVWIKSTIKDLEEIRVFSENPGITEAMSPSLKEKWEFHNFEFKPYELKPIDFTLTRIIWESILEKPTGRFHKKWLIVFVQGVQQASLKTVGADVPVFQAPRACSR